MPKEATAAPDMGVSGLRRAYMKRGHPGHSCMTGQDLSSTDCAWMCSPCAHLQGCWTFIQGVRRFSELG
jgi:hypothetical protein